MPRQISSLTSHLLFWPVFVIGLAADLLTKYFIFDWLGPASPQRYSVINGFFDLVLVENRGAAWGVASGRTIWLIAVSVIALLLVFAIFLFSRHSAVVVFALAFFAAGICGNIYDRFFNAGRVRDFLDFYYGNIHFPAFNVADSMLTVAVALLILTTLFSRDSSPKENNQTV